MMRKVILSISLIISLLLTTACANDAYEYNYNQNGIMFEYVEDAGWKIEDHSQNGSFRIGLFYEEMSSVDITWVNSWSDGVEGLRQLVEEQALKHENRRDESEYSSNDAVFGKTRIASYTREYKTNQGNLELNVKITAKCFENQAILAVTYTLTDAPEKVLKQRDTILDSLAFAFEKEANK